MASHETLGHLEGREKQQSALERLPTADISKRPESVASALQQSQKANELAGRIVGSERAERIQQDNPHTKHPDILSKDPEIAYYQGMLYESLGIDKNTNANNIIKKFSKGMIDGLLVGNAEIIMMIKNEGIEKFVNTIKTQFSTLEGVGQVLKALGMSVWDLAAGDSYERGKSLAELGLITTGAGAAGSLAKYAGKTAIRTSIKVGGETVIRNAASKTLYSVGRTAEVVGEGLQLPAKGVKKVVTETGKAIGVVSEKTGLSPALRSGARVGNEVYERSGAKKIVEGTKQALKSTLDTGIATLGATEAVQAVKGKIGEVLDKRMQAKYEKLEAEGKLIPKEGLDIDLYTPKQLNSLKTRLGLPETATKEEVEKVFRLRLYDAMEQYEKQGKKNLERIGMDIMEQMRRKGIEDPKKMIMDEITRLKQVQANGDLLIISGFRDDVKDKVMNEGLRSEYQLGEKPFGGRKQYGELRGSVDKGLGIHGLDPKYATIVIERSDFQHLSQNYGFTHYIEHSPNELTGRSGITYYDSILTGRLNTAGTNTQMMNLENIIEAKALINMENKYGLGNLEELKALTVQQNGFKPPNRNFNMINDIAPFLEVQIFGRVGPNNSIKPFPTNN